MENNNRETKDYQQPISPLEYLNKRKRKKRKRKYGFTSDYSGASWSSEFMSVSSSNTVHKNIGINQYRENNRACNGSPEGKSGIHPSR